MFNKDCRYVPQLRRHSPTKLCDGAKMATFCVLYLQHISHMHSKFALKPHHVWKYGIDIQSPTAEVRRGKKSRKKEEEDRNHRAKI